MNTLYYKAVGKTGEGTLGPEYVWGLFAYKLKDDENEIEVRKKLEEKHFAEYSLKEVSVLKNKFQSFPIGTSKEEIEKQTEWIKIKTFMWLN